MYDFIRTERGWLLCWGGAALRKPIARVTLKKTQDERDLNGPVFLPFRRKRENPKPRLMPAA